MPSTVKVRIKGARNLASLLTTPTAATITAAASQGRSTSPVNNAAAAAASHPPPTTHVTVTLGGHSAVAEYDDDDDRAIGEGRSTGGHNRTSSKFQWQNMLTTTGGETNNSPNNDESNNPLSGGGAAGSTRTSRCYSARTRTVRKSSNPVFNEEFRFEVADDTLLQDEPLLFHVWDLGNAETSTNASLSRTSSQARNQSSIGLVYVDMNPLLMRTANLDGRRDEDDEKNAGEGSATKPERSGSVDRMA